MVTRYRRRALHELLAGGDAFTRITVVAVALFATYGLYERF